MPLPSYVIPGFPFHGFLGVKSPYPLYYGIELHWQKALIIHVTSLFNLSLFPGRTTWGDAAPTWVRLELSELKQPF